MNKLRTASLRSNFTGFYYDKKECSQLRPSWQILIKLAIVKKRLKSYYHYYFLLLPNSFFVFNNIFSYLSFLKQLQFLAEQSPNQRFCIGVTSGCFFGNTFISHHRQCISSLWLSWFFHRVPTNFLLPFGNVC